MCVLSTTIAALVPNKPINQLCTVFASLGITFPIVWEITPQPIYHLHQSYYVYINIHVPELIFFFLLGILFRNRKLGRGQAGNKAKNTVTVVLATF